MSTSITDLLNRLLRWPTHLSSNSVAYSLSPIPSLSHLNEYNISRHKHFRSSFGT
ncbi:unnamed protein product [Penicillium camemberti]|uniref:Str. FM013 n=1 Tax=Penicillium camemberti (strain FM 013) TaxID=1429867 RepID=A0A0G4P518_PENC3|nr:unnamed protein product [Penicillium camemberti]